MLNSRQTKFSRNTLGMEHCKEFSTKWCLAQDSIRSVFIKNHINVNYPIEVGSQDTDPKVKDSWHTYRNFDSDIDNMDIPIPIDEMLKNNLCDPQRCIQTIV